MLDPMRRIPTLNEDGFYPSTWKRILRAKTTARFPCSPNLRHSSTREYIKSVPACALHLLLLVLLRAATAIPKRKPRNSWKRTNDAKLFYIHTEMATRAMQYCNNYNTAIYHHNSAIICLKQQTITEYVLLYVCMFYKKKCGINSMARIPQVPGKRQKHATNGLEFYSHLLGDMHT